jgi:hypothetical protein
MKSDDDSSRAFVTKGFMQPTRTNARKFTRWIPNYLSLFGLAPGGVYRAVPVTSNAVRSYRTFSPLPTDKAGWRYIFCGTFPRVTPAGRYPAPYFRGARTFLPKQY